jgi:putative ABC transport system permease protein
MHSEVANVTPDYFKTLKVPLLAGRVFTDADDSNAQKVAIVNEIFATRFFGSPQKAIGRMMANGAGKNTKYDIQIVGVVGNYVHRGMHHKPEISLYWPEAQDTNPTGMWYYVRTFSAPSATMGMVRQAVQRIDSKLAVASLQTMDLQIDDNINDARMIALLAESFGVLAMLLAAVGLYGVLAYATAQRTREIGVRMALGADRRNILRDVLRRALAHCVIGLAIGVPLAYAAGKFMAQRLYGVGAFDIPVAVMTLAMLTLAATIAALVPARRAASIEPMVALRAE